MFDSKRCCFLEPKWIYGQIKYFGCFDFAIQELSLLSQLYLHEHSLISLRNQLYLIENIVMNSEIQLPCFMTQLQARLMNEDSDLLRWISSKISELTTPYFRPAFPSLKENNNIEFIHEADSSIQAFFFEDKYLVFGTSQGLLYVFLLPSYQMLCEYLLDSKITAMCYADKGVFIVACIHQIYRWSIKERPVDNPVGKMDYSSSPINWVIRKYTNLF